MVIEVIFEELDRFVEVARVVACIAESGDVGLGRAAAFVFVVGLVREGDLEAVGIEDKDIALVEGDGGLCELDIGENPEEWSLGIDHLGFAGIGTDDQGGGMAGAGDGDFIL